MYGVVYKNLKTMENVGRVKTLNIIIYFKNGERIKIAYNEEKCVKFIILSKNAQFCLINRDIFDTINIII